MKKFFESFIVMSLMIMCVVFSCGNASASTPADFAKLNPVKFSIGHTGALDSMNQSISLNIKNMLEKKSGGKITVDVFPNGQLGSDKDMLASNKAGDITLHMASTGVLVNDIPATNIIDIPFMFDNFASACATIEDKNFNSLFCKEFEKAGYKLVMTAPQSFRCLTSNKKIAGINDLKGMTLRTMDNANHIAFWKELGVNATPLAFSEVYMSLQQGLLDAQENPYQTIYASKFYEVQKYITNSNHILQLNTVTMGLKKYNSLDPAYQKLINEVMTEVSKIANNEAVKSDKKYFNENLAKGCKFIDFDKISGMRKLLREKTITSATKRLKGIVPEQLIDAYFKAAEKAKSK